MRPETKLKIARRKHTIELLRWVYSRREAGLDGANLSLQYRHRQQGGVAHSRSLTYGEVDVPDFLSILDITKPQEGEVFVDLGSGTGKAVLASAFGFPEFSKCRGIELVQGLADAASDHLHAVRGLLANPHPPDILDPTNVRVDVSRSSHDSADEAHSSFVPCRGTGEAGRKKASNGKAFNKGLSAAALEALIAEQLGKRCSVSGELNGGGERLDAEDAVNGQEASAEEIASCLVRELGHRRYKASLKGFGGLQKFLVSRREMHGAPSGLDISEGGVRVAYRPTNLRSPTETHGALNDTSITGRKSIQPPTGERNSAEWPADPGEDATASDTAFASAFAPAASPGVSRDPDIADGDRSVDSSPGASLPEARRHGDDPDPGEGEHESGACDGSSPQGRGGGRTSSRRLPARGPLTKEALSAVELMHGDIFEEPWHDAGVVYVASLLFDDEMMMRLSEAAQLLRKGARVISLRPIPAFKEESAAPTSDSQTSANGRADESRRKIGNHMQPALRLLHEGVFRMSWQMARVYIYIRL